MSTERFEKTPQSDLSVPKCRQICQLPFQGRPWQNRKLLPYHPTAQFRELRADSIRPYSCGGKAADGSTASRPLQMAYRKEGKLCDKDIDC